MNHAVTNGMLARNPLTLSKGKKLFERAAEKTKESDSLPLAKGYASGERVYGRRKAGRETYRPHFDNSLADMGLRWNELFTIESSNLNFKDRVITVKTQIPFVKIIRHTSFYRFFSQMFRSSNFIGGPTCIWKPSKPLIARPVASSSIVCAIRCPLKMCVSTLPRAMMWT